MRPRVFVVRRQRGRHSSITQGAPVWGTSRPLRESYKFAKPESGLPDLDNQTNPKRVYGSYNYPNEDFRIIGYMVPILGFIWFPRGQTTPTEAPWNSRACQGTHHRLLHRVCFHIPAKLLSHLEYSQLIAPSTVFRP